MSIETYLANVVRTRHLAVPKAEYTRELMDEFFGQVPPDDGEYWLVPADHVLRSPAGAADLAFLSKAIGSVPAQLQSLYAVADGAQLYRFHFYPFQPINRITRYRIFSCAEAAQKWHWMRECYLGHMESDLEYDPTTPQGPSELDYLAFCDIGDGDHLAMLLSGETPGSIFYLDHDYAFYPFAHESVREAYTHVAPSLDEWLKHLAATNGTSGTGARFKPL